MRLAFTRSPLFYVENIRLYEAIAEYKGPIGYDGGLMIPGNFVVVPGSEFYAPSPDANASLEDDGHGR